MLGLDSLCLSVRLNTRRCCHISLPKDAFGSGLHEGQPSLFRCTLCLSPRLLCIAATVSSSLASSPRSRAGLQISDMFVSFAGRAGTMGEEVARGSLWVGTARCASRARLGSHKRWLRACECAAKAHAMRVLPCTHLAVS